MKFSTQAITLASARHPWRTIAVWGVVAALALGAIGAARWRTDDRGASDEQSSRNGRWMRRRRRSREARATEAIVVRSRVPADSPGSRRLVGSRLPTRLRTLDGIEVPMEGESAPVISRDEAGGSRAADRLRRRLP